VSKFDLERWKANTELISDGCFAIEEYIGYLEQEPLDLEAAVWRLNMVKRKIASLQLLGELVTKDLSAMLKEHKKGSKKPK